MRELLFLVLTVGAFEPSSLSQKVKMGLNSFLLDQFDMDVIRTEVKNPYIFDWRSVSALQEFLQVKGKLAPTRSLNSLVVGTLQHYLYDQGIYPDARPCGIFGTDTRRSLKRYLMSKPFYRYTRHRITDNSTFDSASVRLLQEYLYKTSDKKGRAYYSGRIDGRFSSLTIEALGRYLHDREARVAFTRDHYKKYHFRKGVWGYKTSIILEQYLVDNGYYLARVDGRFSSKAVYQLSRFLADYEVNRN